jgi:hypothetical protein
MDYNETSNIYIHCVVPKWFGMERIKSSVHEGQVFYHLIQRVYGRILVGC